MPTPSVASVDRLASPDISLDPPAGPVMSLDPLAELNPEQRRAAEAVRGPLCILAGAGTGKTRTITHRVAHQIASGVARPDQVLAVTFTDKAAAQLRARLHGLGVPPVRAATFHAAAWAQLRYFWPRVSDGPLPEVLPSKLRLLVPIARRLRVEGRDLAAEVEWAKARRLAPEDYAAAAGGRDGPLPPARMAEVYADYETAKDAAGAIDYEDMLLRTSALIERDPEVAATVRDRYRFLTVDEYQDVNPAQHGLLLAWLGDGQELCVVGDDDQTIFSFTGASARYLTSFSRQFPGATVVTLTHSYRSTRPVLELANRVLWTKPAAGRRQLTTDRAEGPAPTFREFADDDEQLAGVVARCRELIDQGVPPGEVAVLYRVNAQSEPLEVALRDAGVPYTVRGDGGFFTRPEVRQALRLLAAERDRGPDADPAALLAGTGAPPPSPERRLERVLRDGLGWKPGTEPGGAVARERWRNLGALADAAARRVATEPGLTFEALVDDLVERAGTGADAPGAGGAVTLTTLHRAKGLEFDAVFLVSCEEGLVPLSHAKTDEEVEEERRLLYVGVTRARTHLWVSWARSRTGPGGRTQSRRPSRFLYNLGEGAPRSGTGDGGPAGRASPGHRAGKGRAQRGAASAPLAPALSALDPEDVAAAERLRGWRLERSRQDEVPAFVVCSDRTLAALAVARPSNPSDLLAVHGFGKAKVARYGDELLEVLRSLQAPSCRGRSAPEPPPPGGR